MKKLLEFLVKGLADKKEKVKIKQEVENGTVSLTCQVAKEDMGKIIGKGGKTIKAIRSLLRTKAGKEGKKVFFTLEEAEAS